MGRNCFGFSKINFDDHLPFVGNELVIFYSSSTPKLDFLVSSFPTVVNVNNELTDQKCNISLC